MCFQPLFEYINIIWCRDGLILSTVLLKSYHLFKKIWSLVEGNLYFWSGSTALTSRGSSEWRCTRRLWTVHISCRRRRTRASSCRNNSPTLPHNPRAVKHGVMTGGQRPEDDTRRRDSFLRQLGNFLSSIMTYGEIECVHVWEDVHIEVKPLLCGERNNFISKMNLRPRGKTGIVAIFYHRLWRTGELSAFTCVGTFTLKWNYYRGDVNSFIPKMKLREDR